MRRLRDTLILLLVLLVLGGLLAAFRPANWIIVSDCQTTSSLLDEVESVTIPECWLITR